MRLRRVLIDDDLVLQSQTPDGTWAASDRRVDLGGRVFDPDWELRNARRHHHLAGAVLPFQPASFRDFMLYERHALDAARGLLRRFHPGLSRLTRAYETATRRTFPPIKPGALFYRQPIYYMSNHLSFVPSGTPVSVPSYSVALDYELEIGFVLKETLHNASAAEALRAIGAFVVVNDFSARDVQRAEMDSGLGPQKSKHFASSMSVVAVTAEEILPWTDRLTGTVTVNGRTVETVCSGGMQWPIGELLAHASRDETLHPGELFATGTLPGGSGMETGRWLEPGDRLTLRINQIGEVEHEILTVDARSRAR